MLTNHQCGIVALTCWQLSTLDVSLEMAYLRYRQISNIRCTLEGNKIVDHSDVAGASPVGAAPTTSSF